MPLHSFPVFPLVCHCYTPKINGRHVTSESAFLDYSPVTTAHDCSSSFGLYHSPRVNSVQAVVACLAVNCSVDGSPEMYPANDLVYEPVWQYGSQTLDIRFMMYINMIAANFDPIFSISKYYVQYLVPIASSFHNKSSYTTFNPIFLHFDINSSIPT